MNCHLYINQNNISSNHRAAINEYIKRLTPYCKTDFVIDSRLTLPKDIEKSNHQLILIKKGLSSLSSTELAEYINKLQTTGTSTIHVTIGYSQQEVPNSKQQSISISPTDLSNETLSVLFLEQLYRAYTIISGKTYHK